MKLKPDYSEIIDHVQPGNYVVQIVDYEERTAKATKTPYVAWTLSILEGEMTGQLIFHNTPLSGKGAGILKQFLQAADASYKEGPFDPEKYLDLTLRVVVKSRSYSDGTPNPFPKVVAVGRINQQATLPLEE